MEAPKRYCNLVDLRNFGFAVISRIFFETGWSFHKGQVGIYDVQPWKRWSDHQNGVSEVEISGKSKGM